MLAIDTNVLVRFLTGDHPEQSARARAVIDHEPVFVPTTVLLETEWVLRSARGLKPGDIVAAFVAFAGLPTVTLEHPSRIAQALDSVSHGLDFADALHLAAAQACDAFVTFDHALAKRAQAADGPPVRAM